MSLKKMPRRRAELRKELEALRARRSKQPGQERWRPILALSPGARIRGKRYAGWTCKRCGARLEHDETTSDVRERVSESFLPWVKCHCGHLDRYRWNGRTTEEYRGNAGGVTS
jgi:hypothetical protein